MADHASSFGIGDRSPAVPADEVRPMPHPDRAVRAERIADPLRSAPGRLARRPGLALATLLFAGFAASLGSSGCAGSSPLREQPIARTSFEPAGPGHVFATAELAAIDALAFCEQASARAGDRRGRAGTVYPVAGGFRYDAPIVAAEPGGRLRYRLAPRDVLHFRHLPAAAWNAMGPSANRLSDRARAFVDRWDPLHRPIYFMTPDHRLRSYTGRVEGTQTLARLTPSAGRPDAPRSLVWLTLPASALAEASGAGAPPGELALRPESEAPRETALDAAPAAMRGR